METKVLVSIILLLCSLLSFAYFSAPQGGYSLGNEKVPGQGFYCPWYYRIVGLRGPAYFGVLVNGTLMEIDGGLALKYFNDCGGQMYAYTLWDAIPKHPLRISDPTMMFIQSQPWSADLESNVYMIINGTKWPIMGGLNQTAGIGVKQEMIAIGSPEFLKTYPTGMYLTQPY